MIFVSIYKIINRYKSLTNLLENNNINLFFHRVLSAIYFSFSYLIDKKYDIKIFSIFLIKL